MKKRLLLAGLLLSAMTVAAQTGSIQGTVMDVSHARFPGVQIEVENLDTGQKTTAISDDLGDFKIVSFAPGRVRVRVSFTGFNQWASEFKLASRPVKLEVILEVGSLTQTVIVSAVRGDPMLTSPSMSVAAGSGGGQEARRRIRARDVDLASRKAANLVFLIDVSGSMIDDAKLPLVQRSLHLLVDRLREDDRVTMVVYAGSSGMVLPPTSGGRKDEIHAAIEHLKAGGSTNGGEGIELAYRLATANFIEGGINRVILTTDGDFNVGVTNEGDLVRLVQKQAKSNVFLTVLGYGIGNYKDSMLEKLADKGHGNYAYIDTFNEAKRVLVEQLSGTLLTVAKDVKLQIEFNPAQVEGYRLIGYENRLLADADFENDNKEGGDIGAGHNVTALFEIVPRGGAVDAPEKRPLKYQSESKTKGKASDELLTVSLRYKLPDGKKSTLLEVPVKDSGFRFEKASPDFRFAASVAAFGMLLRESPHKGSASFQDVLNMAAEAIDADSARAEFLELARKAETLRGSSEVAARR